MPKCKGNNYKKILFIEDAPITKKEKKKEEVPLGIIKSKKVRKNFIISAEEDEALKYILQYANKKLSFKINETKAIQILIRGAQKYPAQFIKWVKL